MVIYDSYGVLGVHVNDIRRLTNKTITITSLYIVV